MNFTTSHPTLLKKVVTFSCTSEVKDESLTEVCMRVEEGANEWLEEHPDARIVASHTNQSVVMNGQFLVHHFTITLIVELQA